ncbi:energy coupling factor transporter S component ThiW [Clostridium rectalis]|uniref:energy coupling factor transporter S component ThiW n=1 Tax=Clostridium rectalis TaxID=2040295 RepID=UPI000F6327DB|nr:energy coupling factor transporter S component ThiW [Clostridium rectalis]
MSTEKLTFSALLIAIGIFLGNLIYIPIGISKCFPIQHSINVISAVTLGSYYGTAIAFCISCFRNILSTGSLLAFPGSMVGALLAGIIYKKTNKIYYACLGEIVGTGIIGALLAFPISKFILGKNVVALFFITPFSISTIGGSVIAFIVLKALGKKIPISIN